MYNRILVAVDGSENSRRAAEHAAMLAALSPDTSVEILYVLDFERARTDALHYTSSDDLHTDRKKKLAPIEGAFEQRKIEYQLVIKHGEPGPTIVSFANRGGFDLVVIGSRGLNSFQEMVLGSVSHKVAKRVTAPVLIVK
ncbi:universal stress protein [Sporosarcina sp. ACRSM]|uniref:universal stress protein n=1 Tax=Sporosarcina sp. ACRSM TaxID=2918216 RepID=UPI001EF3F64C|nr:universal stress protein [Sporosarcina sp. ACRSM]MCG7336756.1 universal stress protein [Sporosarcina sp. ACRSM]